MLTADDDLGHGAQTGYLQDRDRWRVFDPELFDSMAHCLADTSNRHVQWAETSGILPSASFFPNLLTDVASERQEYFRQLLRTARGCELVFFDPDNGFEVRSKPYGRKDSCKYLYWHELSQMFRAGHSVLVYQHFRRQKRDQFIQAQADKICEETGVPEIISFRTDRMVFLLAPQPRHVDYFLVRGREAAEQWASQIHVAHDESSPRVNSASQIDNSYSGVVSHSAPSVERTPATLADYIRQIGCRMVQCQQDCEGIALDPTNGILPRCLILETGNRAAGKGSVIVGINPGRVRPREREFYVTQGPTYENTVEYWEKAIHKRKYYRWLRKLVGELGFHGPILWTELAKCENAPDTSALLPLQTFRTCVGMYLQQELEFIPHTWPLIAIGTEAYKAMAYLFPKRAVLGVPHPTGSYGHFARLFDDSQHLLPGARMLALALWTEEASKAVWLTAGAGP